MEERLSPIVIDANLAVALVVPLPYSERAADQLESWRTARRELVVPALWEYEVVSALRKAVLAGLLAQAEAERALDYLLQLGVQRIAAGPELHREALHWADHLGQTVAHDAQYLAVAAHLGAELWTADRRLAEQAREQGAEWVQWLSGQ